MRLDYPRMVQLETTVRCNAECVICPNDALDRADMPTDMIRDVIEQVAQWPEGLELHPFFTNEPFMDRRWQWILDTVEETAPRLAVHYYTNGALVTERTRRRLYDSPNVRFVAFSIDGASKRVYERHRPGLIFEQVIDNATAFIWDRRDAGREDIHVKIVMTATPGNIDEAPAFQHFWRDVGADEVMVMGSDGRAVTELDGDSRGKVGVFRNDPRWPCRRHRCHDHSMYILSSGDVVPCCKDATGLTVLGNVGESPLLDIWRSERYDDLRRKLDTGVYDEAACKRCPLGIGMVTVL